MKVQSEARGSSPNTTPAPSPVVSAVGSKESAPPVSTAGIDAGSKRVTPPQSSGGSRKGGTVSGRTSPEGSSSREVSAERPQTAPSPSATGGNKSGTVDESEEEEGLTNSEEEDEVTVAAPDLEHHQGGARDYEKVTRCRSPGYSDESGEEDGTPIQSRYLRRRCRPRFLTKCDLVISHALIPIRRMGND